MVEGEGPAGGRDEPAGAADEATAVVRPRLPLRRKLLYVVVANALAFGLLFAAGEIYLRATRRHISLRRLTELRVRRGQMENWAQVDSFCAYRGRPGRYRGHVSKTVNEHGFISTPSLAPGAHPGTVRLAFLGGSATAGSGKDLKDRDTWPWKTVERLREAVPDARIDFINAALGGYCSFESFGRLWSRVRFFEPDVVVVYHGWNEMYYFEPSDMARIHNWRTLRDGSWSLSRVSAPYRLRDPLAVDPLIGWSQALVRLRLYLTRSPTGETTARGPAEALAGDWDERAVEVWRANLCLIREACRIMGARLYVAKQATLITPDLTEAERARCRCDYHGFDYDAHLRAWDAIYGVVDQEIPAEGIIDATVLSGRSSLFFDHIHPTPQGATAIAQVMAERLAPAVRQLGAASAVAATD